MKILDFLECIGFGLFLTGIVTAIIITTSNPPGGSAANPEIKIEEITPRFTTMIAGNNTKIITDTKTGVQYLWCKVGYGAGITVLVDGTGKPLIREDFNENDE